MKKHAEAIDLLKHRVCIHSSNSRCKDHANPERGLESVEQLKERSRNLAASIAVLEADEDKGDKATTINTKQGE